jgi:hypothetical protein
MLHPPPGAQSTINSIVHQGKSSQIKVNQGKELAT